MTSVYPIKSVGDVLTLEYGKPLPEADRTPDGHVPAYGANGVLCWSRKAFRNKPSIIVGRKGSAGEVNLTEGPFWPTDVTYFVEHDERATDLKYLFHTLKFLGLQKLAKGVKPGINRNDVYALQVPIPPLPEQKRIVAILGEAFEGIATATANAEKNLANAREIFDSYLNMTFTHMANSWPKMDIVDICAKITDGEHLRPKMSEAGVPFLSAKNVLDDDIEFDEKLFVSEGDAKKFRKRCDPERGDILIVSRGATVGRTSIVKTDRVFCLLGSVILLKISPRHSSRYIAYALKSPMIRSRLVYASEAAAQQAIYLRDIKPLQIPCPKPSVQQQVVSTLDTLLAETKRLENIYQKRITALNGLRSSVLQKAFAGELTAQPEKALREAAA